VLSVVLGGGPSGLEVRPIATRRFVWQAASLAPRSADDIDQLERALAEAAGGLDRLLARIDIAGQVPLDAHAAILARLARLEERLFNLELDRDSFTVVPDKDDLSALGEGNDLERAARRLMALRDGEATAAAAGRALEFLFRLAAEPRK
jgi:hypothetical protein